jgi:peptidyl-tRNA hydrolase
MSRSTLSTSVENDCVEGVKSFIKKNRDDMYSVSKDRKEPQNREIDTEDLARAMVRAAELVWIAHLKQDMKNVIDQVVASGSNAKLISDVAIDTFASGTLTTVGVGPATAVPAAMAPFIVKLPVDQAQLVTAKVKPLNIQVPDSNPILIL